MLEILEQIQQLRGNKVVMLVVTLECPNILTASALHSTLTSMFDEKGFMGVMGLSETVWSQENRVGDLDHDN